MITKQFQHTTHSIVLQITTTGIIDKTDIIGTLYKQLKDVLKDSVSFEDLVKKGNIGNIEIEIKNTKGNSKATCTIPTNLDIKTVCLLAAKCEQITKIGHTSGSIIVKDIIESQKKIEEEIYSRAQELEQKFFSNSKKGLNLDSSLKNNIEKSIKDKTQIVELIPNCYSTSSIENSEIIFFVEGRSDVKHLVFYGIENVISVNGSHLDILEIKKLNWFKKFSSDLKKNSKKQLVLLLDGDSSAQKIAMQLKEYFNFSQILFAPKGKEITQLKKYEINKLLLKVTQLKTSSTSKEDTTKKTIPQLKQENKKDDKNKIINKENNSSSNFIKEEIEEIEIPELEEKQHFTKEEFFVIENYMQAIEDKQRVVGFDEHLGLLFDVELKQFKDINLENSYILLIDGLLENSISKKIISHTKSPSAQLNIIVAKGISTPIKNILTISFNEFKNAVEE
ncbi:MAG: toprim domain-containing protein [Nanoarchaeota archaeon]|nr:toprim domain-containing protein [Nanoarchaeota archaeon]